MKHYLLFCLLGLHLIITQTNLQAQSIPVCGNLSQFAADECPEACSGCQINGYQGSTNGFTSSGNVFCSGEITESNSVWHAFIAGTSPMTIGVSNTNCSLGDGLQIAVLTSCGGDVLACNSGSAGGSSTYKSVTFSGIIGETYLLLINGYNGDVCDYQITAPNAALPPPPTIPGAISGLSQVCTGATANYSVPGASNVLFYEWQAPPGTLINGSGQNPLILPAPQGEEVTITFGNNSSTGQVKVKGFGACGTTTTMLVKTVQVQVIQPTTPPPIFLYPEDLPYEWVHDPGNVINNSGNYQLFATLTSWLGCDSFIQQIIIVQPRPSGRVFWDMNGNNVYNIGTDIPVEGQNIVTSTGQTTATNEEGMYFLNSLTAGAQISLDGVPSFVTSVIPASHSFQTGVYTTYHFALQPERGPASGRIYLDNDQNGAFNAGDTPLQNVSVNTAVGLQTITDANGNYQLNNVAWQDHIYIFAPPDLELLSAPQLDFIPSVNTGYDFRLRNNLAYGKVWLDADLSNTISGGDVPVKNISLIASSGAVAVTNIDGMFSFAGLAAGDTIRVNPPGISVLPTFHLLGATPPPGGYQFLLIASGSAPDLSIDLTNLTVFRPGFDTKIIITVKNELAVYVPNATVGFRFPGMHVSLQSAQANPDYIGSDSVHWNLGALAPFEVRQFQVTMRTNPATTLNSVLHFYAWVYPVAGDLSPSNNADILTRMVLGAYDPNDKQVDPEYITPSMLTGTNPFEYTIRFQNTGNYPADIVNITDTLSDLLDRNSVRVLASSHFCTWSTDANGVLKFQFPGILLPDSVHNEPASHGFVKFAVNPKPGLLLGNTVVNNCDIFFDFNPPVRTNTVKTEVVYFLPGTIIPTGNKALSVRPNPASFQVRFSWPDLTTDEGVITLYNMNGMVAASVVLPEGVNSAQINTAFLPDGLYLAVLEAGGLFYTKRVVVLKEGPIRRE